LNVIPDLVRDPVKYRWLVYCIYSRTISTTDEIVSQSLEIIVDWVEAFAAMTINRLSPKSRASTK